MIESNKQPEIQTEPVKSDSTQHAVKPRCPQCNKPIETPVMREITQRDNRRYGGIRNERYEFCSAQCGAHYQMGCEGWFQTEESGSTKWKQSKHIQSPVRRVGVRDFKILMDTTRTPVASVRPATDPNGWRWQKPLRSAISSIQQLERTQILQIFHNMKDKSKRIERTQKIIPPADGWKPNTVYIVNVSWNGNNPIHQAILHTGFITDRGEFGGYCEVWQNSYESSYQANHCHYLEFVRELATLK